MPKIIIVKEPIFRRGLENELVQHPLHIWFVTSGFLGMPLEHFLLCCTVELW